LSLFSLFRAGFFVGHSDHQGLRQGQLRQWTVHLCSTRRPSRESKLHSEGQWR